MLSKKDHDVTQAVASLIRALMAEPFPKQLAAHAAVCEFGSDAVPPLRDALDKTLQQDYRPEITSMLTGLALALHDVDENASRNFIDRALSTQLHAVHAASLRSIRKFTTTNYRHDSYGDIAILEHSNLDVEHEVSRHVREWLRFVPPEDLDSISRIYIISADPTYDYLGTYLQGLAVITLVWNTRDKPNSMLYRILRTRCRITLYHEIGHHALGHDEPGQVPEQEKEADIYAARVMQRVYPNLARFVRFLRMIRLVPKPRWAEDADRIE
ncbi:MAG: hypothetical protein VYD64_09715 [Pseudomonadota bacterium]|nr:hypothetical protein [Pseudomonadota bacterium]